MAETVTTGGLKQFVRRKGDYPKASQEYKLEIEDAYDKYYERKKRERKQRIWLWILVILIILIIAGVWWFSRN